MFIYMNKNEKVNIVNLLTNSRLTNSFGVISEDKLKEFLDKKYLFIN